MPHTLCIRNGSILLPDGATPPQSVLVEDDRIVSLTHETSGSHTNASIEIDATDAFVAPGFIDLHIHGTGEYRVDGGPDDLEGLIDLLPRYGVTGFLPTLVSHPDGEDRELLKTLSSRASELEASGHPGARVHGFFLEGPFIALSGAGPRDIIGSPTEERIAGLIEAAHPYRAIFAASPELEGMIELLPSMAKDGTPVFLTHTAADVSETKRGIAAGISHATHFYDVFPCPAVTEPGARPCGAVEAVLADPTVTVDFILDGEHVEPVAVEMALVSKGPGGVSLVTDANVGAGLPPGEYTGLAGKRISFAYEGAPARAVDDGRAKGGLTGSGLTMDRAVRNAMSMLDLPMYQAVRMASANPAAVLGIDTSFGAVKAGATADLVVLESDGTVRATIAGGQITYRKER